MIDAKLDVCDGGLEDEANRYWTRAEWSAAIDAAPKSPSEEV